MGNVIIFVVFLLSCSSAPQATDSLGAQVKDNQYTPQYYDFGDVLIPRELNLNAKSSFIYQTSGFITGVLVFESKVERLSLIDFFSNNMAKDNWRAVRKQMVCD